MFLINPHRHKDQVQTYQFVFDQSETLDSRVSVLRTVMSGGSWTHRNSSGTVVSGTSANTARLEHNSNGDLLGLLVEPASTNLVLNCQNMEAGTNTLGENRNPTTGVTDPMGTSNAVSYNFPANTNGTFIQTQHTGLTEGQAYTQAYYIDASSGTQQSEVSFRDWGNSQDEVFTIGYSWERYDSTSTYSGSSTGTVEFDNAFDNNLLVSLWGSQLEPLPYATTLILTTGSAVTRPAETAQFTGIQNNTYYATAQGQFGTYTKSGVVVSGNQYDFTWDLFPDAVAAGETICKTFQLGPEPEITDPNTGSDPDIMYPSWFVDTQAGSDDFTGTRPEFSGSEGPFRTLAKALERVSQTSIKNVYVKGTLESWNTSTNQIDYTTISSIHNGLRLMRLSGQETVWTAGQKLNNFVAVGDGTYSAVISGGGHNGLTVSVDHIPKRCATTNAESSTDPLGHFMFAQAGSNNHVIYREADASKLDNKYQDGLFFNGSDKANWNDVICKLSSHDANANRYNLAVNSRKRIEYNSGYTFLNRWDWIQAEGEYGWKDSTNQIFYKPESGEDPTSPSFNFRVGRIGIPIIIDGAQNIVISGFKFADLDVDYNVEVPLEEAPAIHNNSVFIDVKGQSSDIRIVKCHFEGVGIGVYGRYSDDVTVAGCTFKNIGKDGVLLWRNTYQSSTDTTYCDRWNIQGNRFEDIGIVKRHGGAVNINGTRNYSTLPPYSDLNNGHNARGHYVDYNEFLRCRRWAVGLLDFEGYGAYNQQFKSPAKNCRINRNKALFTSYASADSAAFYQLGRSYSDGPNILHNCEFGHNYFYHTGGRKSKTNGEIGWGNTGTYDGSRFASCIYLDDLTNNGWIHHNVGIGWGWCAVHPHGGDDIVIEDNCFVGDAALSFRHMRPEDVNFPAESQGQVLRCIMRNNVMSFLSRPNTFWDYISPFTSGSFSTSNNQVFNINGRSGDTSKDPVLDANFIPTSLITGIDEFFSIADVGIEAFDKTKLEDSTLQNEWDNLPGYVVQKFEQNEITGLGFVDAWIS